jgi:Asp-tRNA(Asn)/Glu-tRNA(Gln) amidotransferase A subunit family amidase
MSGSDWVSASATSLARDIRAGRRSSVEIVTAVLERIEAVNPRLNAVVQRVDGVLDAARQADTALAEGRSAGPLHGLPFTIKDT